MLSMRTHIHHDDSCVWLFPSIPISKCDSCDFDLTTKRHLFCVYLFFISLAPIFVSRFLFSSQIPFISLICAHGSAIVRW